jgi:hypothetical protein
MFVTFKGLGRLGRLGNQLFQIAATIGLARNHGWQFVFPPWPFAEHFAKPIPQSTSIGPTPRYFERSFCYHDIHLAERTDLVGFFQSEKYFKHCEQEVRDWFTPRPQLAERLQARFGDLSEKNTCSLHVRRGSYVHTWHERFVDLALGDYYEKAMQQLDDDTVFVVFSDEIAWCKYRFRGDRFVFMEGQQDVDDLFLMSRCQSHIIANSSFSWWAAWLDQNPGKTVIAPAAWFAGDWARSGVPYQAAPLVQGYHDTKDLLPDAWVRL